jgi:hypothetical protein
MKALGEIEKNIKEQCDKLYAPNIDYQDFKRQANDDIIGLFKRLQAVEQKFEPHAEELS